MRKILGPASVLLGALLVMILSYVVVVSPVWAFSVGSSATGFVTRATATSLAAMQSANLVAEANAIAAAAFAGGGTSLAIEIAAAAGFTALGVVAGLGIMAIYYSASDLASVKAAAATPGGITGTGGTGPPAGSQLFTCASLPGCSTGTFDQVISQPYLSMPPAPNNTTCPAGTLGAGWVGPYGISGTPGGCGYYHYIVYPATYATSTPSTPATQPQIATYVGGLPSTDPNSIPAHQTLQGWGSSPQPADQTVTIPVAPSGLATSTVPATSVTGTDVVLNPNATPPPGPAPSVSPTQSNTQTSTTTSTTTTSGGTTTTTATTTSTDSPTISSCSVGNHDQRTFGGVLQQHMSLWQGSGLYSALNLLKTLTWPTAFQTYSLTSTTWGTFTIDFSAYATVVAALRTIIIALASFVAYRIVFVGGR